MELLTDRSDGNHFHSHSRDVYAAVYEVFI